LPHGATLCASLRGERLRLLTAASVHLSVLLLIQRHVWRAPAILKLYPYRLLAKIHIGSWLSTLQSLGQLLCGIFITLFGSVRTNMSDMALLTERTAFHVMQEL